MDQQEFELFSNAYMILLKWWYKEKYDAEVTGGKIVLADSLEEVKPPEGAAS